jgi:BirA family biotin operon repressor/biotin-[acetyl-CoA-carboxylase] ligase
MIAPSPVILSLRNPFGAPVYYWERLSSTMDEARNLASRGAPHGTVVAAGLQDSGRGRKNRPWSAPPGESLLFTILLRYPPAALPPALTLRAGLALALAVEDFAPALKDRLLVKWPNDLMIASRKAAGVLTEGDGEAVYVGMGVNVSQTEFPKAFRAKAVSIGLALEAPLPGGEGGASRFILLERILSRLWQELPAPAFPIGKAGTAGDPARQEAASAWRKRLEERLYRRGETVRFINGEAGSGLVVEGVLEGIGPGGELLIRTREGAEPEAFITGELDVYPPPAAVPLPSIGGPGRIR